MKNKRLLPLFLLLIVSCNSNHTSEYNKIDRNDVAAYEAFILKYPQSSHVSDARERIAVARERQRIEEEVARKNEEVRRLESLYGSNSLSNGAQPYSLYYGSNHYYDDYTPHSEIRVKAPYNSDVIAIVRYNNQNGNVAGHIYVKAGYTSSIYLRNGFYYQTFFYYGQGWYPNKEMKNGVKGGFIKNEVYSKDGSPSYLEDNILTYELTISQNGNFSTSSSNENEVF